MTNKTCPTCGTNSHHVVKHGCPNHEWHAKQPPERCPTCKTPVAGYGVVGCDQPHNPPQINSQPVAERCPQGTFACPICGHDKPHHHTDSEQAGYQEDMIRSDGWQSVVKRQPEESGWYLCHCVVVDDVPPQSRLWSQLSWFRWVRAAMEDGDSTWMHGMLAIPEVLYFDRSSQRWYLRNCLGDAASSGAESRKRVNASPRYWRDEPIPKVNTDALKALNG